MTTFTKNHISSYEFQQPKIAGFPLVLDDMTLAFKLGVRNKTLWHLLNCRNKKTAYKCFSIPQFNPDGTFKKCREIQEPIPHLKYVQGRLNDIFASIDVDDSISAYVKGKSCVDAAAKHVRGKYEFDANGNKLIGGDMTMDQLDNDPRWVKTSVTSQEPNGAVVRYNMPICMIKVDIKNFFPSIKASWIRKYFNEDVGYSHYVSSLIATLCSVKRDVKLKHRESHEVRHLPQGAPISGSLANLIGWSLFGKQIRDYLDTLDSDWVYTIYSDDIVLTHPSKTLTNAEAAKVADVIMKLVATAGFEINVKKVCIKRSEYERIKILGCIVNDGVLNVPSEVRNKVACIVHNCKTQGFASQCKPGQTVDHLLMYLRGMLEYIRSIRPDVAELLYEKFNEALVLHGVETKPTQLVGKIA